ncbi:MAG: FMN-binding protein [Chlorobi bacterium]|nr:FMN-binding protein [Chlorobiota bacterium]
MQSRSNTYTYVFVIAMAVVSALLLSLVKTGLQERQEFNRTLDVRKNILKTVGVLEPGMSDRDIESLYQKKFSRKSVEGEDGKMHDYYVFGSKDRPEAYVLPVSGKGVWSTINGFIALEADRNTVRGISFYEHGETPGLGGEIEKDRFTREFKGKKIFRDGKLVSITIAKARLPEPSEYAVDGISGASLTTGGINRFLKDDLLNYLMLLRQQ